MNDGLIFKFIHPDTRLVIGFIRDGPEDHEGSVVEVASLGDGTALPLSASPFGHLARMAFFLAEVYDSDVLLPTTRMPELGEETRSVLDAIGELEDTRGRAGIREISESTGRTKQSLNYQLNILRREGLVRDIADPKDRRCRSIGLTDKGRMVAGWA